MDDKCREMKSCDTCKYDGVEGASYDLDKCYGCNTPNLKNWKNKMTFYIIGRYKGREEIVDSTEDSKDAEYLRGEYQMAYGPEWVVRIEKGGSDEE